MSASENVVAIGKITHETLFLILPQLILQTDDLLLDLREKKKSYGLICNYNNSRK